MKIAFICIYSHPSICGVWSRVINLGKMLIEEGEEVHVFSTNIIKGTKEKSQKEETIEGIKIHRFSPHFSFGENVKFWDFKKKIKEINPDLIIADVYRHPHTRLALKMARKMKKRIFLVTHSPFVEPELRSKIGNIIVKFYDKIYGRKINKFDKIITITKWELPYLKSIGVDKNKIEYIPNGIQKEFFTKKRKKGEDILFFGRISRIKDIETLIKAISVIKSKENLRIVGPAEEDYKKDLEKLVDKLNLRKRIKFYPAVYGLEEKIKTIDKAKIFVLPSRREAMPQSLIEAMARGKIVIGSENKGISEIITSNKNGFIFPIGDYNKLGELIDKALEMKSKSMEKEAIKKAREFRWEEIFNKFYKLIR